MPLFYTADIACPTHTTSNVFQSTN